MWVASAVAAALLLFTASGAGSVVTVAVPAAVSTATGLLNFLLMGSGSFCTIEVNSFAVDTATGTAAAAGNFLLMWIDVPAGACGGA